MTALPTSTTTDPFEHRVLRRDEVEHKTGLKRAHIYALMRADRFPKTIPLGKRAVGWDSREIEQWIADRCAERS
ncbi:AlpA family transcriptional regulator [Pseudomonas sp. MWU12-2037]|uniref:AlpA family transcriptional regulator n=1 Tax=Pseudomonas sp. MWU12-2037 TaxID=2928690 RepID=UPI00200CCF9E|nr:AlpA family transcriptional regulator [Pseudomonas sp. MWU12-2037]